MKIAVIGAGMAGLACAEALAAGGSDVTLFDKGRRAGGRMSTRIVETAAGPAGFDHGAQYFSVRDPGFSARVERWAAAGVAARWPAAGIDAWVGTPGMSAPIADMASRLDVRWSSRVAKLAQHDGLWQLSGERVEDGGFAAVLLAVPAEQVAALAGDFDSDMASLAESHPSQPCWTLMASFDDRLPIADDVIEKRGPIAWAARNSAKPERVGPEAWVIQAGAGWSREHLEEDRAVVADALLAAFAQEAGVALPPPLSADAHRWRYAKSGSAGTPYRWNAERKLGLCGDWLLGPRVECAWQSGTALAGAVLG